ncbi:MAG TPA: hypothetical protein VFR90_06695 [Methylibium sp.]|uniref:hypothetical protein n=1 Tax=Methylibium sp. TaxID=2067992 RepID=UPI002DBB3BBB|nr:hypothetical protein [Methylibium sp.]HEU4458794.1 hypothetical protein [Methylibium sp.]
MHLLIPHAASLSEAGQAAWAELALPHLEALLRRLETASRWEGDEYRLSMPHERVLGLALGWVGEDGTLPWAARSAAMDGVNVDRSRKAWGLISPVHWQVGREHLTMGDPDDLELDPDESRAFFEAVQHLFREQGWVFVWRAPTRWYVQHESLAGVPTASLDRVIGRNPDLWMPDHPAARAVKRLQSEVQMLLHTHPRNAAREAAGKLALNSFWLSGCGLPQLDRGDPPRLLEALRAPALRGDWLAWREAWRELDAGPLREALAADKRGEPVKLTLCGERHALGLRSRAPGFGARLASMTQRWRDDRSVAAALATL